MPRASVLNARPYAIRGNDGTVVYQDMGMDPPYGVVNTGALTINRGEAVYLDVVVSGGLFTGGLNLGRWDLTSADVTFATELKLSGKRVDAAANKSLIGVALQDIPVSSVASGLVGPGNLAGPGWIVPVKCLTVASLSSNVQGNFVEGSATAGSVDALAATGGVGRTLGKVLVIAGLPTGSTPGSGSLTQLVAMVTGG